MRLFFLIIIFLFFQQTNFDGYSMSGKFQNLEKAYFAGGCFWCIEAAFQIEKGVLEATSGYMGGSADSASYRQISTGKTKHFEVVEIIYSPKQISYEKLLDIFWQNIDPTDAGGQFADRGSQYLTAIFYRNNTEKELAEKSLLKISKKLKKEVATQILPKQEFYPAEEYHQDYYQKNKIHYNLYKEGSGRNKKLKEIWEK